MKTPTYEIGMHIDVCERYGDGGCVWKGEVLRLTKTGIVVRALGQLSNDGAFFKRPKDGMGYARLHGRGSLYSDRAAVPVKTAAKKAKR